PPLLVGGRVYSEAFVSSPPSQEAGSAGAHGKDLRSGRGGVYSPGPKSQADHDRLERRSAAPRVAPGGFTRAQGPSCFLAPGRCGTVMFGAPMTEQEILALLRAEILSQDPSLPASRLTADASLTKDLHLDSLRLESLFSS